MRTSTLSLLAFSGAAQLVSAIAFLNPAENATLAKGTTYDLQWSTVDTDPTSLSVYLVNFVNWPPFYQELDLDVDTSAGEASVRIPCDIDDSYGYQFNAINGTNVYVIYAQTPKFSIGGASCVDPVTTSSVCAAAPTATVTVTVRGNSSSPSSSSSLATATGAAALNYSSPVTAATATATSSAAGFSGTCPSTIGWNGDYGHPVTLTSVPHADRGVATHTPAAPGAGKAKGDSEGEGYSWTTKTVPNAAAAASATTAASAQGGGLTGAESVGSKGSSKGCPKSRPARKRHSDNGHTRPFPRSVRRRDGTEMNL